MFSDSDYMTSPSVSKIFPSPAIDSSSRKLYHDGTELLTDSSVSKHLTKEIELPIHKLSVGQLEASVDVACRSMANDKLLDASFENPSLKEESLIETGSRKISLDRTELPIDIRRMLPSELDSEFPVRKVEREMKVDLMDTASKTIYRERSDLSLDARKILWNETLLETSPDVAPRKISRDMMGTSIDSSSRKLIQDDGEHAFDSRRIIKESMGMSLDTGSKKLTWNKGECQLDSSMRALAMDKMVETVRTPPRKISRDELEYCTNTASLIRLPRESVRIDISAESKGLASETSTSKRILRDELEIPAGSLRRRKQRIAADDTDTSTDNAMGKISSDRVHASMDMPKQSVQREEFGAFESSSASGQIGQPDLMVTSQVPWKSSSEPFAVGPLSQLVYDGILEKSCSSMATSPTSLPASTSNLSQNKLPAEVEPLLLPSKVPPQYPTWSTETGDEKIKEKEKSKKSLKLKNLFKKKNESSPEKPQSGLQKL